MVVDAPEWNEDLSGHAAVKGVQGDEATLHAVRTEYVESGPRQATECGVAIPDGDPLPKEDFSDELDLCPECWPESVRDPS